MKATPITLGRAFRYRSAVLPLLCLLLGFSMHNGFNAGRAWQFVVAAIAVGVVYAFLPRRLSGLPAAVPLAQTVIAVWIPYLLALAALGIVPADVDMQWLVGLYLLFVGYNIVNDIGTRASDSKAHRPTIVTQYGKRTAVSIALVGLVLGGLLIIWQVHTASWMIIYITAYTAAIGNMLLNVPRMKRPQDEQFAITLAGREYVGLIATLVASFIADSLGGSAEVIAISAGVVTALMFSYYFVSLSSRPIN